MKNFAWALVETKAGEFWLVPRFQDTFLLDGEMLPVFHYMVDKRAKKPLAVKQIWHQCEVGEPLPATFPVEPDVIEIAWEWMEEVAL